MGVLNTSVHSTRHHDKQMYTQYTLSFYSKRTRTKKEFIHLWVSCLAYQREIFYSVTNAVMWVFTHNIQPSFYVGRCLLSRGFLLFEISGPIKGRQRTDNQATLCLKLEFIYVKILRTVESCFFKERKVWDMVTVKWLDMVSSVSDWPCLALQLDLIGEQ